MDGANGWEIFRDITWNPSHRRRDVVLIGSSRRQDRRLPTCSPWRHRHSTESLTLHAFIAWRTQQLGESAAIGYVLLFLVSVACVSFFTFVVQPTRVHELEAR